VDFLTHGVELFLKGGPVMYGLLLCSLVVVAIAAERLFILPSYYIKVACISGKITAAVGTALY